MLKPWKYVRYNLSVLWSKIKFGRFGRCFWMMEAYLEKMAITRRLSAKGHSEIRIIRIRTRFAEYQTYLSKKEGKVNRKRLNELIVLYSEQTGVPQWDVRARLERDFGIDV